MIKKSANVYWECLGKKGKGQISTDTGALERYRTRIRGRSNAMNGLTGKWVGIDASKCKVDAAVLDDKGKTKSHVFNSDAKGLTALLA